MKYFVLIYEVVDGFLERRTPFRQAHLAYVRAAHERGELLMAGALGNPDGGLLVFRAATDEPASAFARADPYVTNGLVRSWTVRPWAVVTPPLNP